MKRTIASIAFGLAAGLAATAASAQATLNNVKQKGFLACGSNPALPFESEIWRGAPPSTLTRKSSVRVFTCDQKSNDFPSGAQIGLLPPPARGAALSPNTPLPKS